MAPAAFLLKGIRVNIYFDDHLPIHIHALHQDSELVVEVEYDMGKPSFTVRENKNFPITEQRRVMKFLRKHHKDVVKAWTEIAVLKKTPKSRRISGI